MVFSSLLTCPLFKVTEEQWTCNACRRCRVAARALLHWISALTSQNDVMIISEVKLAQQYTLDRVCFPYGFAPLGYL